MSNEYWHRYREISKLRDHADADAKTLQLLDEAESCVDDKDYEMADHFVKMARKEISGGRRKRRTTKVTAPDFDPLPPMNDPKWHDLMKERREMRRNPKYYPGDLEPTSWLDEEYGDSNYARYQDLHHSEWHKYTIPLHDVPHTSTAKMIETDLVAQSNYQLIEAMVEEDPELEDYVVFLGGSHGSEGIAVRLDKGELPQELLDVVNSLHSYPLLDEMHHSELEMEEVEKDWDDYGREQFRTDLASASEEYGEAIEDANDSVIDHLWYSVAGPYLSWNTEHDNYGTSFNIEDAIDHILQSEDELEEALSNPKFRRNPRGR